MQELKTTRRQLEEHLSYLNRVQADHQRRFSRGPPSCSAWTITSIVVVEPCGPPRSGGSHRCVCIMHRRPLESAACVGDDLRPHLGAGTYQPGDDAVTRPANRAMSYTHGMHFQKMSDVCACLRVRDTIECCCWDWSIHNGMWLKTQVHENELAGVIGHSKSPDSHASSYADLDLASSRGQSKSPQSTHATKSYTVLSTMNLKYTWTEPHLQLRVHMWRDWLTPPWCDFSRPL